MKIIALFLVFGLVACASTLPSEENLSVAVAQATQQTSPDYKHAFVDLNDDGVKDAIILLRGSYWCGSGGCTMLILEGRGTGYTFISRSTVTNEPVRVSKSKSGGWQDIIVNSDGAEKLMRFNGEAYPLNPSVQPAASQKQIESAKTVLPSP